jgi:predicted O-linked N-acetylglucosamine transferase (SPINDLY family)
VLHQIGLEELVAKTPDEYVNFAVALATDPDRLALLRQTLRPRMQASPLCDGKSFARDVEAAYREMWRGWCAASAERRHHEQS